MSQVRKRPLLVSTGDRIDSGPCATAKDGVIFQSIAGHLASTHHSAYEVGRRSMPAFHASGTRAGVTGTFCLLPNFLCLLSGTITISHRHRAKRQRAMTPLKTLASRKTRWRLHFTRTMPRLRVSHTPTQEGLLKSENTYDGSQT